MKQLTKRILSFTFALMLFASVVGTAFATGSVFAGIYLSVGGTCVQSERILYGIDTTTYVRKNPDRARLVTKIQYSDDLTLSDVIEVESDREATEQELTFGIADINGNTPVRVFRTHEVRDGISEGSDAYAYYTSTDISNWELP